jgi:pyrroloquinoline quinone (PQQ) biosynthesis protein C
VTEATFTAIGRFPKTRPDLMKPCVLHDIEEADHGEMALKDYIKLGGDETSARSRRISPASFAMSAVCRLIAQSENPFGYLGYMYLFEGLTPILAERARRNLESKQYPKDAQYFMDFHAEEDIAHARSLRNLIVRIVGDFPDAAAAIDYAFDCFAAVYPVPIWDALLGADEKRVEVAGS